MTVEINVIGPDNVVRESYTADAFLLIVQDRDGECKLTGSAGNLMSLLSLFGNLAAKLKLNRH